MFATEGWSDLEATLGREGEGAYAELRSAKDMDRVARAQGKLEVLEWLLKLPGLERTNLRTVEERIQTLEGGE